MATAWSSRRQIQATLSIVDGLRASPRYLFGVSRHHRSLEERFTAQVTPTSLLLSISSSTSFLVDLSTQPPRSKFSNSMLKMRQGSSHIKDFLLTTPVGQAVCLLRSGLARIRFGSNAKRPAQVEPDLEHQNTSHTLTKEPSVAISEHDDVSMEQSQLDSASPMLAQNWPMAKRVYTSVVICLYT